MKRKSTLFIRRRSDGFFYGQGRWLPPYDDGTALPGVAVLRVDAKPQKLAAYKDLSEKVGGYVCLENGDPVALGDGEIDALPEC